MECELFKLLVDRPQESGPLSVALPISKESNRVWKGWEAEPVGSGRLLLHF